MNGQGVMHVDWKYTLVNWLVQEILHLRILLYLWDAKTIKVVIADARDINDSMKTRSKNQCGSVVLIACVLKAWDLDTYVDTHSRPEWENSMDEEYFSLMKNAT